MMHKATGKLLETVVTFDLIMSKGYSSNEISVAIL